MRPLSPELFNHWFVKKCYSWKYPTSHLYARVRLICRRFPRQHGLEVSILHYQVKSYSIFSLHSESFYIPLTYILLTSVYSISLIEMHTAILCSGFRKTFRPYPTRYIGKSIKSPLSNEKTFYHPSALDIQPHCIKPKVANRFTHRGAHWPHLFRAWGRLQGRSNLCDDDDRG